MDFLLIISVFLMVFSVLLIIRPSFIINLNRYCNKVIFTDSEFFSSPKLCGISLIVAGVVIVYIGYIFRNMTLIIKF